VTDTGIPVVALVAGVSPQTHDAAVLARFSAELKEREPRAVQTDEPDVSLHGGRVEELCAKVMKELSAELKRQPRNPDNVFIVLNALAGAAAVVLAGCNDQRARDFFARAVTANLDEARTVFAPRLARRP
jgi:hypothetical protein